MTMITILHLVLFITVVASQGQGDPHQFKVIREWRHINFTWPDHSALQNAMANGDYIPESVVISGVKHWGDHYYLTLPRMKDGVPATLARITTGLSMGYSPPLEPFPSWKMNKVGDCDALQSVQNVEIDTKGKMYVIDIGRVNTLLERPVVKCKPKVVVLDMENGTKVGSYEFPDNVASSDANFLYDLVLDDTDGGYLYITDNSNTDPGIVVYSIQNNTSWKVRHPRTMKGDPNASHLSVGGVTFDAPINIAPIALGPIATKSDRGRTILSEDRLVYYCPLSSFHLYALNSSVLRNPNFGRGEYQGDVKDLGVKASQTSSMVMDNKGMLYYSLLSNSVISMWNSKLHFTPNDQKAIGQDLEYLQWPNSFAFDNEMNILTITNKLNKFIYLKRVNLDESNFRLLKAYTGSSSYLYENKFNYKTGKSFTGDASSTTSSELSNSSSIPDISNRNGEFGNVSTEASKSPSTGGVEINRISFRVIFSTIILGLLSSAMRM